MSKSFYIAGHVQPTLILCGLGLEIAWYEKKKWSVNIESQFFYMIKKCSALSAPLFGLKLLEVNV